MRFLRLRRECEAKLCDRCFSSRNGVARKYPENIPTDIVEVRFRSAPLVHQNANIPQLKRATSAVRHLGHDIGVVSLAGVQDGRIRCAAQSSALRRFKKVCKVGLRHREMAEAIASNTRR